MTGSGRPGITRLLLQLHHEDPAGSEARDLLYRAVYDELRAIAGRLMRGERPGHTLQPTAVVHEAYLRLVDQSQADWRNRAQFYAVAARVMRRLLVDHARRKARLKRGGGGQRITWEESLGVVQDSSLETIAVDDALTRLSALDPRMERIVELRVFGGMTLKEVAHVLGVSRRTVDEDWMVARQWLAHELAG